ncbi:MAG: flagellin [Spirochaetia bacterium]|nr:flagellin [Spirochaetia bacterium]
MEAPAAELGLLEAVQSKLSGPRTKLGVRSHTLELTIKGKQDCLLNLQDAQSSIRDLDMAKELAELSRNMVLYKSATGIILRKKNTSIY